MTGIRWLTIFVILATCAVVPTSYAASIDAGEAIYRSGTRSDGSPVRATVRTDVNVSASVVACESCHRRSGLGGAEGRIRTPPIAGAQLFAARAAPLARPAYDERSLRRALVEGIGADGKALDPLMPRYRLDETETRALAGYLRRLGAGPVPGVTDQEVHLVTIVADSTPAPRRAALLGVIERYVRSKNAGSRREVARAAAAKRHPFGERRDRAFRQWNWTIWELKGKEADWPAQLEALYARDRPFAVLSGATGDHWPTIGRFCEARSLPCVLPITDVAGPEDTDYYTLYFSAAAELEARVAARDLARAPPARVERLLLVSTDDSKGRVAVNGWRKALDPAAGWSVSARNIPPGHIPSPTEWRALLEREQPDVLIAWVPDAALMTLGEASGGARTLPHRIYTLASFASWKTISSFAALRSRVRHIYPYRLPHSGRSQFPREEVWLRAQGLEGLERETAVRALFACHALGEGLADIGSNFSRDYLLESLEHVLDGTEMNTIFPHTTLGPGQRFLSRGAYVTELSPRDATDPFSRADWLQL